MNDSRYKRMKIFLVILITLTIGLFCLQTFGVPFLEDKAVTQYYRANKDINPYDKLTPSMFTAVSVSADKVPDGLVKNFNEVNGLYAKGAIYKGDYLTPERAISTNEEVDLVYTMEIKADYSGPLQYDEYVDIYTLSKQNVPEPLFKSKKLYSAGGQVLAGDETAEGATQTVDKKYIKVTKQEMLEYFSKMNTYTFIVLPIDTAYVGQESNAELSDVTDEDVVAKEESDVPNDENKTFAWTVKTDETWESIAYDWNTDEATLKELNPGVKSLKEGINIKIPAETDENTYQDNGTDTAEDAE